MCIQNGCGEMRSLIPFASPEQRTANDCFVRVRQFYYFHVHSKLIVDGHQNLIINLANEGATTSSWEKVRAPGIDVDDVACDEFDFCLTLLDRRELINRA